MLTDETALVVYSVHLNSNSGGIEKTTPKRKQSARQPENARSAPSAALSNTLYSN
jgi:hypothetical protein